MAIRASHGNGAGRGPRIETLPFDELPYPEAGQAAPLVTGRDTAGKVRSTAAARALASLPRRQRFVPRALACDPRFEIHNRRRLEYLQRRRAELYNAWSHVSHGVSAMLVNAAWLWAASEFANELGAESGDVEKFRTAGTLAAQAKQLEASAWELCERESRVQRKDNPHANLLAQLASEDVEEPPKA